MFTSSTYLPIDCLGGHQLLGIFWHSIFDSILSWSTGSITEYSFDLRPLRAFRHFNVWSHLNLIHVFTDWVFGKPSANLSIPIFNISFHFSPLHWPIPWVFIQPSATSRTPTFNIWSHFSLIYMLNHRVFIRPSATASILTFQYVIPC